jgi:hypothetical protein
MSIQKCFLPLRNVSAIPGTFRGLNRPRPTQPSPFVSTLFKPLDSFLDAHNIPKDVVTRWRIIVSESICISYQTNMSEMLLRTKQVVESLRRYGKNRGNSNTGGATDEENIKQQCQLDVELFRAELKNQGCDIESMQAYRELQDVLLTY